MTPSSPAKKAAASYVDYENGLGAMLNRIENGPSKSEAANEAANSSPDMQNNPAFNLKAATLKAPGSNSVFSRSSSPANIVANVNSTPSKTGKENARDIAVVTPSYISFGPAGVGR